MVELEERTQADELPAGFRITEAGPLPCDWSAVRLGDVSRIQTGNPFHSESFREFPEPGTLPLIRIRDLLPNRANTFLAGPHDHRIVKEFLVRHGDILVGMDGNFHTVRWQGQEALLNQRVARPRDFASHVDPAYIFFALSTPLKRIEEGKHFTTVKHLSIGDLRNLLLPLPPLSEQRAIAHVLSTVERAREATEAVIAATRELKRSLMRHLSTYGPVPVERVEQLRLKNTEIGPVRQHWQVRPLKSCIHFGPQNGLYKHQDFYGRGIGIVRVDEFGDQGDYIITAPKLVELSETELRTYELHPGDLLVNRVNGSLEFLGKTAIVGSLAAPLVFESNMMRLSLDATQVMPAYVLAYLVSPTGRAQIQSRAKRGNQFSINQGSLGAVLVPVMPLDEQRAVAERLSTIADKLHAEEALSDSLMQLARALMSRLLTGEVRPSTQGFGLLPATGAEV